MIVSNLYSTEVHARIELTIFAIRDDFSKLTSLFSMSVGLPSSEKRRSLKNIAAETSYT